MAKPVWVTPSNEGWKVKSEGADRAAAILPTQGAAIERGREIAKNSKSELIVQGENGRIREKNSYGNDPRRTKG